MKCLVKLMILTAVLTLFAASPVLSGQLVTELRVDGRRGGPVSERVGFSAAGFANLVLKVQNGDAGGGRRISSALVTLNGSKVLGPADFNQKVHLIERPIATGGVSNTLEVTVRSNPGGYLLVQVFGEPGFNLPPDPGSAGEMTIAGVDSNGNGIRDDVERWIYLTYPNSEKVRQALIQEYHALQNMAIHGSQQNRDAVHDDMTALGRAVECLRYVHPDKPHRVSGELKAQILNTPARAEGYLEASRLLGGGTFSLRRDSQRNKSCNFDPDTLSN